MHYAAPAPGNLASSYWIRVRVMVNFIASALSGLKKHRYCLTHNWRTKQGSKVRFSLSRPPCRQINKKYIFHVGWAFAGLLTRARAGCWLMLSLHSSVIPTTCTHPSLFLGECFSRNAQWFMGNEEVARVADNMNLQTWFGAAVRPQSSDNRQTV